MTNVQKKRQAQAECIIAQFIPLTDNPHDTRHKAVQRYQRTFYTRAIAAAQRRGLNLALAHKLTLQRLQAKLDVYMKQPKRDKNHEKTN